MLHISHTRLRIVSKKQIKKTLVSKISLILNRTFLTALLAGTALEASAAQVQYGFSGFAGTSTIEGYFTVDTDAAPGDIPIPGIQIWSASNSSTPIVDFGITSLTFDDGTDWSFFAQRPIDNNDPSVGTLTTVKNNVPSAVGGQLNSDEFMFVIIDQNNSGNPANFLFSTTNTENFVNFLFGINLSIRGTNNLLDGTDLPSSMNFTAAHLEDSDSAIGLQIGSAAFDENNNVIDTAIGVDGNWEITNLYVVPIPSAGLLLMTALIGLAGIGRIRKNAI